MNDENEQRFNEIDDLYEQIAELCNGKDMAGTVTCLSMLWIQGVHVMGLSKRQALMAVTDFINDVYPDEDNDNGNRTIQ